MARNHQVLEKEIKTNKENIESLTKELKESSRNKEKEIVGLKDEIKANKEKIASLEEELRVSRSKEKSLEQKIKSLGKKVQDLKKENETLVKRLEEIKGEVEKLRKAKDEEESIFIIMQIGTKTQRNMCKYVLGEHFNEDSFYKIKDIEKYIKEDLKHKHEQEAARQRLKELLNNITWNQRLVDSLKNLNRTRIGTAHPELSCEKIQQATSYLKEENILTEGMINNINKLREQWEISEVLLRTSSTEGQDKGNVLNARGKMNGMQLAKPLTDVEGIDVKDKEVHSPGVRVIT